MSYKVGIDSCIITLRGTRGILDSVLARIYGVQTKRLNEQVRRNAERFPPDFMFQLTALEASQLQPVDQQDNTSNRSQIATGSSKHRDPRYTPFAFTEHGAIMAANVLNSADAIRMSVFVVRAFIKMREELVSRVAQEKRLAEIEKLLVNHDTALRDLYQKIRPLLLPPPDLPKKNIGFHVKETSARYRIPRKQRRTF